MPTETRTLAMDRLTKASVVETHVGSLRPISIENRGRITRLSTYLLLLLTELWATADGVGSFIWQFVWGMLEVGAG